jgi:hypothetical protein
LQDWVVQEVLILLQNQPLILPLMGHLILQQNRNGTTAAYAQFLALAQAFEDTGVRAYKGQAANLISTDLLTAALQIHVEARHASEVRRLRD